MDKRTISVALFGLLGTYLMGLSASMFLALPDFALPWTIGTVGVGLVSGAAITAVGGRDE